MTAASVTGALLGNGKTRQNFQFRECSVLEVKSLTKGYVQLQILAVFITKAGLPPPPREALNI